MSAALPMPDRAAVVVAICGANPEVFEGPVEQSDARRLAFLPTIVRGLIARDGADWGILTKTDQGNKIPADIVVWRPTREHVDVMTDKGPAWIPRGVIANPAWQWTPIAELPAPPRPPDPPAPIDLALQLAELRDRLSDLARQQVDIAVAVAELLAYRSPAPPTYRGSVFGFAIVLRPDPPAGPR